MATSQISTRRWTGDSQTRLKQASLHDLPSTFKTDSFSAPARHKPHIDQHQRRELRRSVAETAGYIQKRSAAGPLRGR